jgi:hypothetical protein
MEASTQTALVLAAQAGDRRGLFQKSSLILFSK